MKKIGFLVSVISLAFGLAAFAQETSGQQPSQAGQTERPRERLQNLSPEERAKIKEKWQTMSEEERAKFRAQMREKSGAERTGPEAVLQQKGVADQIAALKKEHQAAVSELQAIKQLAVKEKAVETAKALDKLMARRDQEFQKRIETLQQRAKRMDAATKQRGDQKQGDAAGKQQRGDRTRQRNNTSGTGTK